jgi:hypothetical protein
MYTAAPVVALTLLACTGTPTAVAPNAAVSTVNGALVIGRVAQNVAVGRSKDGVEQPVRDARVAIISDAGDTVVAVPASRLQNGADGQYYFRAVSEKNAVAVDAWSPLTTADIASLPAIRLQPGHTYRLEVSLSDGTSAYATTTIPKPSAALQAVSVQLDSPADTMRFPLALVDGASRYTVTAYDNVLGKERYSAFVRPPSVVLSGDLRRVDDSEPVFPIGGETRVLVTAVDEALGQYLWQENDPLVPAHGLGNVHGALGVFGAYVPMLDILVTGREYAAKRLAGH